LDGHLPRRVSFLDHLSQQLVDLLLTVTEVTTFDEVVGLLSPSSGGGVELEGPQEVGGVLEVGADSEDLVDQVLNANDAVLAEVGLNNVVGGQGSALALNLSVSSLVDKLTDGLQIGGSPGNVGFFLLSIEWVVEVVKGFQLSASHCVI